MRKFCIKTSVFTLIVGGVDKMSKQKQSDVAFLMMKQWREQLALISDEQRGKLLTAIYDYQCDGADFDTDDAVLKILWVSIKQVFEINNKKYEEICERNRINGSKHKKNIQAKEPSGTDWLFSEKKKADIDIETDKDTDIDTDIDIETEIEKDREADTDKDCTSAALSDLRILKSRFDEMINKPYFQTQEMLTPDHRCRSLTLGEMIALHEFVEENALERYFSKAGDYPTTDAVSMILRWAIQDGAVQVMNYEL